MDVIAPPEPWWPEALAQAAANLDEAGAPVLTLPYLVVMKLRSGRLQDVADVSRVLGYASDDDLGRVRSLVSSLAPDLADDLESLITLGRLETGRA